MSGFVPCPGPVQRAGLPLLVVAAAALVDAEGRVLVAARPAGKHLAGLWEFPGGKLEAGETPEQALVRELAEELDILTATTCLTPAGFASHQYEAFHLALLLFACRNWQGVPAGRQGQEVRWARVRDLWSLDMPPADRPLIAQLEVLL